MNPCSQSGSDWSNGCSTSPYREPGELVQLVNHDKPRIKREEKLWICRTRLATGYGYRPDQAYREWKSRLEGASPARSFLTG